MTQMTRGMAGIMTAWHQAVDDVGLKYPIRNKQVGAGARHRTSSSCPGLAQVRVPDLVAVQEPVSVPVPATRWLVQAE